MRNKDGSGATAGRGGDGGRGASFRSTGSPELDATHEKMREDNKKGSVPRRFQSRLD